MEYLVRYLRLQNKVDDDVVFQGCALSVRVLSADEVLKRAALVGNRSARRRAA